MLVCAITIVCVIFIQTPVSRAEQDEWTIMIYLCGSDLESKSASASSDILEMLSAGIDAGSGVNVIVETGGTSEWWIEGIDPTLNQRWLLDGDVLRFLEERPSCDMGAADTLYQFIDFAMRDYPAKHYGLVLWDHGSGATGGICYDEGTGNALHMSDVHTALAQAETEHKYGKLDFVGFDACLMAGLETAQYLADYADYMLASEELEPGSGWDYAGWLSALSSSPTLAAPELLVRAVDTFVETSLEIDADDLVTLSILDLSKLPRLNQELDNIGDKLEDVLENGDFQHISRKRQSMRAFGEYYGQSSDMVDLGHFAQTYAELVGADTMPLQNALDEVVVYSRHSDNMENISGLSILLPFDTCESAEEYLSGYDLLSVVPSYSRFLLNWTELLTGGDYVFEPGMTPVQVDSEGLGAMGFLTDFLNAFYHSEEQPSFDEVLALQDGLLGYSVALSEEDLSYLSHVEGNLMIDLSDEDGEYYVDLGYLRDVSIDWDTGMVYSLLDGTWPVLEKQVVYMIDQVVTASTRRSLIDVTVNGEEVYLLVVFDEERPSGEVVGYSEGYNEQGLPVRGHKKLVAGDVIVPMYDLLYWDAAEEMQTERFAGDPITYAGDSLSFGYQDITDSVTAYVYAFCFNDVFGGYSFSDFVELIL